MTEEDKILINKIINQTSMTSSEVSKLQGLIQRYIDPKCWICNTCPAQIRFAWVRLKEWWALQEQN